MIRDDISLAIAQAIQAAQSAGDLPAFDIPALLISRARVDGADYACSVALQLARVARLAPAKIAETIVKHLAANRDYTAVAVNGYVNLALTPDFLNRQIDAVAAQGAAWGNIGIGGGKLVQVEHGSANPTGFASMGTARNVTVGDTLANVLEASGYRVHREWYINDRGAQIARFGASLYSHYARHFGKEEPLPPKGYPGEDVVEVAQAIAAEHGDAFLNLPKADACRQLADMGVARMMARIRASIDRLGVRFDNFFSEKSLYPEVVFEHALPMLRAKGLLREHEGALWFSEDGSEIRAGQGQKKTSEQYAAAADEEIISDTDEKGKRLPLQAVVLRSPAVSPDPLDQPTYFASDIAYVWNKLAERKFERAIYVWGEDHQGDVARLKAVAAALGLDPQRAEILIYRFITLMRGGVEVRMGKRSGNAIWLDNVLEEVGRDATRFTLLSRSIDTKIMFDLEVLKKQTDENPVYYVQYSHARMCSIQRKLEETGEIAPGVDPAGGPAALSHPSELALARKILELPELVELVSAQLQPHHIPTYALSLAAAFSAFYRDCRLSGEARDVMLARLKLGLAARFTLARVLRLMGMDAPERM